MAVSSDEMLKAADQVWGMLDHLAEHNPQEYHKFVHQQLTEGKEMFSAPEPAFCLRCNTSDVSLTGYSIPLHHLNYSKVLHVYT